ncbi:NAD(P)-binding domain-containing protein, partial [Nocardiopsis alborubida]
MPTLGIIGSGNIGTAVARPAVAADIDVLIANSRGPRSLAGLVEELGPVRAPPLWRRPPVRGRRPCDDAGPRRSGPGRGAARRPGGGVNQVSPKGAMAPATSDVDAC